MLAHPAGLVLPVATLTLVTYRPVFPLYALVGHRQPGPGLHTDGPGQGPVGKRRAFGATCCAIRWSLWPRLVGLSLPPCSPPGSSSSTCSISRASGLEYFNAATTDDFPVMLGITVLVGLATVVGNLLADIAYAVLDPRVRY